MTHWIWLTQRYSRETTDSARGTETLKQMRSLFVFLLLLLLSAVNWCLTQQLPGTVRAHTCSWRSGFYHAAALVAHDCHLLPAAALSPLCTQMLWGPCLKVKHEMRFSFFFLLLLADKSNPKAASCWSQQIRCLEAMKTTNLGCFCTRKRFKRNQALRTQTVICIPAGSAQY